MSNNDHASSSATSTSTPSLWTIVTALVVAIGVVTGIGYFIAAPAKPVAYSAEAQRDIAQRLQKVGQVTIAEAQAAPADGAGAGPGKALYDKTCMACHGSGAAGAPKFGSKADWAPRIATGMEAMLKVAIGGKGAMPPRGGSSASDDDLKATVQYMVDAAK